MLMSGKQRFHFIDNKDDIRTKRHRQRAGPARIGMVRTVLNWNLRGVQALDRVLFPESWRKNADYDFEHRLVPELLRAGMHVWDVGCGSRPLVGFATKQCLRLRITGLDIDSSELDLMAPGLCDSTLVADLCLFRGDGAADLVLCRTVLEHVADADRAFAGLVSIVRPGGIIAICVPCRNALFARLNLLIPESAKRFLLYWIWPQKADGHSGFQARYDRCTPTDFFMLAEAHGLRVRQLNTYWKTTYFTFLLPLWASWRICQLIARAMIGDQAAEGFVVIAERSELPPENRVGPVRANCSSSRQA
jgi:2-polyprenyl-3-methyl-5-hydroxy-6-metoxy-1,4-benzoquinol methylase